MTIAELQGRCLGDSVLESAWREMALAAVKLCSTENEKGWDAEIASRPRSVNGESARLKGQFQQKKERFVQECEARGISVPEFTARDVYDVVAH